MKKYFILTAALLVSLTSIAQTTLTLQDAVLNGRKYYPQGLILPQWVPGSDSYSHVVDGYQGLAIVDAKSGEETGRVSAGEINEALADFETKIGGTWMLNWSEDGQNVHFTQKADFQSAYDNLPVNNGPGRVSKMAAAAYMGKAKLYQGKWSEAKQWFDIVIGSGQYMLLDDYMQIFNAENDNHAESIMDVESANNTGSTQNANYFDDLNYPYNTGADGPGNCCGFFQPSFELGNSFRTSGGLPLLDGSYNDPGNEIVTDYNIESSAAFAEDAGE